MGMKGIVAGAGLLAMTAGVFLAPQASATAPPPKLSVSPAKVAPGQALDFSASCHGTPTAVTSPGLTGPVTLSAQAGAAYTGNGKAAGRTGKFKASFRCDGGPNLPAASGTATVEFEIVCPPPTTTPTKPPSSSKPPSSGQPPSSSEPPSSSSASSSSSARVVPAALTKPCGTPGKTPQVKVKPAGAPQTGGGI
ncbi:hypothetical protein ACWEOG_13745 [Amycolatopsis japonica]